MIDPEVLKAHWPIVDNSDELYCDGCEWIAPPIPAGRFSAYEESARAAFVEHLLALPDPNGIDWSGSPEDMQRFAEFLRGGAA